jgi:hypothetical protein
MGTSDGFLCGGSINVNCQLASVLKNKHQAVSQGVRRFGKRSI